MKCICHARKFEMSVRLRRGVTSRTVRFVVATRLDEPDRLAPQRVADAFFRAVEVGLFGPSKVVDRQDRIEVVRSYGVMSDVFEASFSRATPMMFAPLARMVAASVPGAVRLEVLELSCDERALLVRGFEAEEETTILDVDWQIDLAATDTTSLLVGFVEEPRKEVLERLSDVLRAWSDLVALGAWPPSDARCAEARLTRLAARGAEVIAKFDSLGCGYGAFEALFAALDAIHDEQALGRVAIPYRVNAPGDGPRSPAEGTLRRIASDTREVSAHG